MKNRVQGYLQDEEYEYFMEFCKRKGISVSAGLNEIILEHRQIDSYKEQLKNRNYNSNMYKEIMTLKEIVNTYLHLSDEETQIFVPTSIAKHPIIDKAEQEVGRRISEKKQYKDSKRYRK